MGRVLKGLGVALAVLVLAGGALILVWDWNWFKDVITGKSRDYTGRELHIDGEIALAIADIATAARLIETEGAGVEMADLRFSRLGKQVANAVQCLDVRDGIATGRSR